MSGRESCLSWRRYEPEAIEEKGRGDWSWAYRKLPLKKTSLTEQERDTARKRFERLDFRYGEALDHAQSGGTYTLAEHLYSVTVAIEGTPLAHKHGSPDTKQSR